ncbi:MAG: (4Fe-4S)-binding protein [Candidatus Zixiibacteriota bacterium]|nr:MAG: (4Fe-4S)-binding protein [candidate division Zixibacteria bacterium]
MRIAIASGKGGTGKTTVAVNLAWSVHEPVQLLDCDVEEPNAHLFLRPEIQRSETVSIPVPEVDESRCDACGECSRLCAWHAIVSLKTRPLVFPDLCHGCGGCARICPLEAIREMDRPIGTVETGVSGPVNLVQGRLNIGAPMAPPLIRAVKARAHGSGLVIVDAPPGTSCPVIAAVRDCDFLVLVTEPTPFGLHDLVLAVDMVRELRIPFGVVINRAGMGDDRTAVFCRNQNIPILQEIPDDRRIAEAYARGRIVVEALPEYQSLFQQLLAALRAAAKKG